MDAVHRHTYIAFMSCQLTFMVVMFFLLSYRCAVKISLLVYHTLLCCLMWWGKVVWLYYMLCQMALIHSINDRKVRAACEYDTLAFILFNDYYIVLCCNIHISINITFRVSPLPPPTHNMCAVIALCLIFLPNYLLLYGITAGAPFVVFALN